MVQALGSRKANHMNEKKNNAGLYIGGGILGALLGVITTHVLIRNYEEDKLQTSITPQKGLQIGMNTIGFIRNLFDIISKT